MKVSIVTCTWNSEPFIEECIRSVQALDYPDLEHVFVDGGSTDGTLERIKALPGQVRWVSDVRGGISHAMNVGAEMARGDVIAHLHGDDYYLSPDVVSQAVRLLESSPSSWVFGRIVSDVKGQKIPNNWTMPRYTAQRLLKGNFIAHPAVFMKRSLFLRAGGFDAQLKYAMDYDLWLRCAKLEDPVYLDLDVAAFRCHEGSASTANEYAAFLEDHEVRKRHLGSSVLSQSYHGLIHRWRHLRRYGRL